MDNKQNLKIDLMMVDMPEANSPVIREQRNKDWVTFGEDNDYFTYLIELYKKSAIHKSLVDGITRRIIGGGFDVLTSSVEGKAKAKNLLTDNELFKFTLDFKLLGNAAFWVTTNKAGVPIKLEHLPFQKIRPQKSEEVIEGWWYSKDWENYRKKDNEPEFYEAWTPERKAGVYIYVLQEYFPDMFYFGLPDYIGGLKAIEQDIEIADYHLSNIKMGFSASTIISWNTGIPTPQQQDELNRKFKQKFTGSKGGKFVLLFGNRKDEHPEITAAPIPDADKQYEFLSKETRNNIIVAHRVTSPMLLGIRQETGLGNNADEITVANDLFDKVVIAPYRRSIIEFLEALFVDSGVGGRLKFEPFQLGKQEIDKILDEWLENYGEEINDKEWELAEENKVDDKLELVSTGTARPNAYSEQDGTLQDGRRYRVRYSYEPKRAGSDSRLFCQKMTSVNKVYRKEDILQMGQMAVNAGFGPNGSNTYSIWQYKGGPNCHHFWMRKVFLSKGKFNPDPNNPASEISVNKAKSEGVIIETNNPNVAKLPIDMPNNGYLNPR